MTHLTRPDLHIPAFGEGALAGEIYNFGTTTTPSTLLQKLNANFVRGWRGAVPNNNSLPTMEDFNALLNAMSELTALNYQDGVPKWVASQEYYVGSLAVGSDGSLYRSLTGTSGAPNLGNDPILSPTNWSAPIEGSAIKLYNPNTNTPAISTMRQGDTWLSTAIGVVSGVVINGADSGVDSILLNGDAFTRTTAGYSLLTTGIYGNQTLNFGAGGHFATLQTANTYLSNRVYNQISLNQLSNVTETASINVRNNCGGLLSIFGGGFTITMSAGFNYILSGDNIYVDNLRITANHANQALYITGRIIHDNGLSVTNTHATGYGIQKIAGADLCGRNLINGGSISVTPNITISVSAIANSAYMANGCGSFSANNVTCNGQFSCGVSSSNYIIGAITTGGGQFYCGASSSNYIGGAITTGGGQFSCGVSSSNYIGGAITTGGGQFNCGVSSSNCIIGAITTGGGQFNCGSSCSNYIGGAITTGGGQFYCGASSSNCIGGAITTGGGQFNCGSSCSNFIGGLVSCGAGQLYYGNISITQFGNGATGTGGVDTSGGSTIHTNGFAMPAGTPAIGTNTAQFRRPL